jgi:hypothetical protein
MTASPLTTLPIELQHSVNVRRTLGNIVRTSYAQPPMYAWDPAMRCDHVRIETGPRVGVAELTYVPLDGDDDAIAFENILAQYTTDDLVQIVGHPYGDQLQQQADTRLFEGRIDRHTGDVQGSPGSESEGVRFTARALPALDNESADHQVTGRWIITIPPTVLGDRVTIVRSPSLPAVFNFRGRPNMAADTVDLLPAGLPIQAIPFYAFTYDGDHTALYWTVRDAMLSLLAVWLIGTNLP